MDKETLSNYGWIVICVLVMVVMIALAGPFGNFISEAVKSTAQGLFDTNKNALDAAGITIDGQGFADGENGGAGDAGYDHNAPELHPSGIIPEGATYKKKDGTILNAGDSFPEEVVAGDLYKFGDYEYGYRMTYMAMMGGWVTDSGYEGWTVYAVDKTKAEYEPILESINKKPVVYMYLTFQGCTSLSAENIPAIPSSVVAMSNTFKGCSFTDLSNFVIPTNVTTLHSTFSNCTSLKVAPVIPGTVTNLAFAFQGCTSLNGTIIINTNSITTATSGANNSCYNCFQQVDMTNITLTGSASKDVLNLIGATGNNWIPIS